MTWIAFTIFAAFMQSIRTAGQKSMGNHFSPMGNTCVRYLFSWPWAAIYALAIYLLTPNLTVTLSVEYFIYAAIAGICQIAATAMLVALLTHGNFAVGTVFSKSEVLLTAILGSLFFTEVLSHFAWWGIILCSLGLFFLIFKSASNAPTSLVKLVPWLQENLDYKSAVLGLGSGGGFALTALFIKDANNTLNTDPFIASSLCLFTMISMQTVFMCIYLIKFEPDQFKWMGTEFKKASFIGITSLLGSIGWFTALALTQASYVRAVGQVELIFALLISRWYFHAPPSRFELFAMVIVSLGILLVILEG